MSGLFLEGVVFDVDGVLFDTEALSRNSWAEVGPEMGWPQVAALHEGCTGKTRAAIRQYLLEQLGPEFPADEMLVRGSQRMQDMIERDGVPFKPGVFELMDFLRDKGLPVALATSTGAERTFRRIELAGLGKYLRAVVTGDDVSRSKPDPEIYLTACAKLGVDPQNALAVEDSPNGVRSAHAAGMRVALVPDLIPPTPELEALAWKKFASLLELRACLEALL